VRAPFAALALVAAVGLTGCAAGVPDAGLAAAPTLPRDAGHVHGLGIDPADGKLYLGTHGGLLVVDDGDVRKVGDATIDLMGFAVAGPQHYYASGHPGPKDDLPDPVGLLETRDGGKTWTALSLTGRSDFHALAAGDGRIYGFDGQLRWTDDGRTWTDGPPLGAASVAVHPADADTLVATTEQGPVRSADGGAAFSLLSGAPRLVLVSWPEPGSLWGVGTDGSVHVSSDSGTSWEQRGAVGGPPEAFTAADADTVVAAVAGINLLVRSDDGGQTFTTIARTR
jgi:photosystem II stability/assembly factor-like uncharacterized protein